MAEVLAVSLDYPEYMALPSGTCRYRRLEPRPGLVMLVFESGMCCLEYTALAVEPLLRPAGGSMRSVRVADLCAEEVGERFSCSGVQNEGLPANAIAAQPDAQTAAGGSGEGKGGGALFQRVAGIGMGGRVERHSGRQPGARLRKIANDLFEFVRVELAVQIKCNPLARLWRRFYHGD